MFLIIRNINYFVRIEDWYFWKLYPTILDRVLILHLENFIFLVSGVVPIITHEDLRIPGSFGSLLILTLWIAHDRTHAFLRYHTCQLIEKPARNDTDLHLIACQCKSRLYEIVKAHVLIIIWLLLKLNTRLHNSVIICVGDYSHLLRFNKSDISLLFF